MAEIENLTHLQSLDLYRTPVKDLHPLTSLTRLQSLDLRMTPVQDLRPLANLTHLQTLELVLSNVSDEQVTWLCQRLPQCKIVD
jgi:Leucine-rich repeat (LRR) protein